MKLGNRKKQPGEKRRYGIDYKDVLDPSDEIISVVVNVDIVGLTVDAVIVEGNYIRFSVAGGVDGVTYKLTFTITTTDDNEIIEDEVYIKVKEI